MSKFTKQLGAVMVKRSEDPGLELPHPMHEYLNRYKNNTGNSLAGTGAVIGGALGGFNGLTSDIPIDPATGKPAYGRPYSALWRGAAGAGIGGLGGLLLDRYANNHPLQNGAQNLIDVGAGKLKGLIG